MLDARSRLFAAVIGAAVAMCGSVFQGSNAAHAQAPGLQDVSASVVDITVLTAAGSRHACGFVVREDGLIATNLSHFHGVETASIRLASGTSYDQISLYAADGSRDFVIFQVPATGLQPVPLGDSNLVHAGDSIQTTCCGADPMCAEEWAEVTKAGAHELGVDLFEFSNPPVPWMSGAPILDRAGRAVGIANILLADQSRIAVTSNDIKGILQNPFPEPVTLAAYIEWLRSQAAAATGDNPEQTPGDSGNVEPQGQGWSMAGSWRVPNLNFIYMFVEDQGQLKGKEVFETGGSTESFFLLDKVTDTRYEGIHHFLWGCSVKKNALSKWKSKTCHVEWKTTLEQMGPGYAVLEYEGFTSELPEPGDKTFIEVCETCGANLPKTTLRHEIVRTQ